MSVTLNKPFSWESATGDDSAMLDDLQPNIIKAHTREFLKVLFSGSMTKQRHGRS